MERSDGFPPTLHAQSKVNATIHGRYCCVDTIPSWALHQEHFFLSPVLDSSQINCHFSQVCSTCKRNRVPSWLQDANGRAMLPGSIVRCPRDLAQYIPPPAPVEPADAPTPSRPGRGRSPQPLVSSPQKGTAGSGNAPSSFTNGVAGVVRRFQSPPRLSERGSQQNVSPNATPSRRGFVRSSPSPKRDVTQSSAKNNDLDVATSPKTKRNGAAGTFNPRRGDKKRPGKIALDPAAEQMKANFEAQEGDRVVMVVAVNGYRPQPPRGAQSLEGYCIVVSAQ